MGSRVGFPALQQIGEWIMSGMRSPSHEEDWIDASLMNSAID
jgi:hypothetical protein